MDNPNAFLNEFLWNILDLIRMQGKYLFATRMSELNGTATNLLKHWPMITSLMCLPRGVRVSKRRRVRARVTLEEVSHFQCMLLTTDQFCYFVALSLPQALWQFFTFEAFFESFSRQLIYNFFDLFLLYIHILHINLPQPPLLPPPLTRSPAL